MPLIILPLLAGFLALMPWALPQVLSLPWADHEHDSQRLVQVALYVGVAMSLALRAMGRDAPRCLCPSLRWDRYRWAAAVTAALVLLSVSTAHRPAWAMLEAVLWGGMCLLAWSLATASPRQQAWLWAAALAGAGLFSLTTVLSTVVGMLHGIPPLVVDAIPGYSNIRHWNHVQVAAIPLMIGAIWHWRALRVVRWLGWLGVVSCVALVWTTGGRAASIALLGGAVLLGLLLGRKAWPVWWRWSLCVLGGVGLGMALLQWLPAWLGVPAERLLLARPITPTTESARLELWSRALDMAVAHPWLGVGPMHFANQPNPIATHPHNVYVQWAAEWGVPLALGAIGVVVCALWRMAQRLRHLPADHQALYPGMVLWWGCAAVMIDGLFSGNFVMPMSQVWIATLCGLAWGWWRGCSAPVTVAPPASSRAVAMALLLWCVLCAAALVWTAAMFMERMHTFQSAPNAWQGQVLELAPRFWTMGWFE